MKDRGINTLRDRDSLERIRYDIFNPLSLMDKLLCAKFFQEVFNWLEIPRVSRCAGSLLFRDLIRCFYL